ncbi:M1 family metallopeptidase [Flavihumibacter rivuli]|uniref:M1 family metallopeptidase n=1 Tax=Flavihumibacter rivuli TaxID=2838156 RepID=UPI001BDF3E66|nr:M1 family metallopeptidase [Flavihumibacter rivuli]ULQ56476.1 M1 family metallopeptidase [Flavihumibacter rivuli]
MKKIFVLLSTLFFQHSFAQSYNWHSPEIDVIHYDFNLRLKDESDEIEGTAGITLRILRSTNKVTLDLAGKSVSGKGMQVINTTSNSQSVTHLHHNNLLELSLPARANTGDTIRLTIHYRGIPEDGLIISRNKFNKRTFFADNWPNRARNWIPCNDHPSDKATVDFLVTAPNHYQVVSNGIILESSNISPDLNLTHWHESVPIPTKVMVIGAAQFAVGYAGELKGVPVSSWVFPEEKKNGFHDYAQTLDILPFFTENIAPFPFEKLASVQSKTIFGGMENAGCIFYHENSVNGARKEEALISHEIAHQWFGNSATEKHWSHIWLSEGFATYLSDMYLESRYGADTLKKLLEQQKATVVRFYREQPGKPIVDSTENNYMELLNANSYQKAAWVLHMIRKEIGDQLFWRTIRNYYQAYKGKNATTEDFLQVLNSTSGRDFNQFFQQWLRQPGHPRLSIEWKKTATNKVSVRITQLQEKPFQFKYELQFSAGQQSTIRPLSIDKKETLFELSLPFSPEQLTADPSMKILAETIISTVK